MINCRAQPLCCGRRTAAQRVAVCDCLPAPAALPSKTAFSRSFSKTGPDSKGCPLLCLAGLSGRQGDLN